jgi:putative endonuclease
LARHNELGKAGEEIAAVYLQENGYQILEKNWKFNRKEIDIIAQKGRFVVFVEVKTRSTDFFGRPEEAVTHGKQKFLIGAADQYLQQISFEAEARFDILSVIKKGQHMEIKHIPDAFIPLIN